MGGHLGQRQQQLVLHHLRQRERLTLPDEQRVLFLRQPLCLRVAAYDDQVDRHVDGEIERLETALTGESQERPYPPANDDPPAALLAKLQVDLDLTPAVGQQLPKPVHTLERQTPRKRAAEFGEPHGLNEGR